MYIALEFRKNIVKCSLTAPLDTRLFYFDLNWRLNSKTLKELTKVSLGHNQSQVIFYESTLILKIIMKIILFLNLLNYQTV